MTKTRRATAIAFGLWALIQGAAGAARADILTLDLSGPSALTGGATIHDVFSTAVGDSIQALVADIGNDQSDVVQIDFGSGPNGPGDYGSLLFADYYPPRPLVVGSYPDATRFGSAGHPALDVTFRSSGFNVSTGSFDITKIDLYRDPMGTLQIADFAATFVLFGDGSPDALTGAVTFVGSAAVPEPSSLALCGLGAVGLIGYARRRRAARG